jgi:hypothetical protein
MELNGRRQSQADIIVEVAGGAAARSPSSQEPPLGTRPQRIELTTIPRYDSRGGPFNTDRIAGRVTGITPSNADDYRIVIYAKTLEWFVQPREDTPFTTLAANGEFDLKIYLGSEYAVLLVSSSYTNAPPRIPVLPPRGSQVLEVTRVMGIGAPVNKELGEPR